MSFLLFDIWLNGNGSLAKQSGLEDDVGDDAEADEDKGKSMRKCK